MKKNTVCVLALAVVLILSGFFVLPKLSHQHASAEPGSVSDSALSGQAPSQEPPEGSVTDSPASDINSPDESSSEEDPDYDPGAESVDNLVIEYDEDQSFTIG